MRFMRVRVLQLVGAALLVVMFQATATGAAGPDIVISGSGWGHGVGLSQYGAKAMAADGATYQEILNRYFVGVSMVPVASVIPGTLRR